VTQATADYLANHAGLDGLLYPSAQAAGAKKTLCSCQWLATSAAPIVGANGRGHSPGLARSNRQLLVRLSPTSVEGGAR
jgi:hypothetical protein